MRKLRLAILVFLTIGIFPAVSWSGDLESAQKKIQQSPNDAGAHYHLGISYSEVGQYQNAIIQLKKAIQIKSGLAKAHHSLGYVYKKNGQYHKAITSYNEAIELKPGNAGSHYHLGISYSEVGQYQNAIIQLKKAIQIKPDLAKAHHSLAYVYKKNGQYQEAIIFYKEAIRINPDNSNILLSHINKLEQKVAQTNPTSPIIQPPQVLAKQTPKSGVGSGFFVSKMGHVITNAHVVQNCKKITIGDNANKQVPVKIINTDTSNDLALLKLSTLEMVSTESKSLIQKLSIVVVPLASKGLLRSDDVRLGENVLVAGYPFGELFSNTIKVTSGIVSATRGAGDDSGQFQLDAAVQPGNSGGPIYDIGGNIVGVVISQLDKLKMAKAIGSLPENVNFGIKASTVRQFLMSSGLPSKKSQRTEEKSTEQLAEIAKNQALMVMCLQ
jgi:S1-C subfamily serine protease